MMLKTIVVKVFVVMSHRDSWFYPFRAQHNQFRLEHFLHSANLPVFNPLLRFVQFTL
jgi:hypothetical protein